MNDLVRYIESRCVECGDCLVWQGYMHGGKHPQFRRNGTVMYARLEWWKAKNGPVPAGKNIAHTCETRGCICHTEPQTISKIQKRVGATGVYSTPARCKKISAHKRATMGKLTDEQVHELRTSNEPASHLAERFGICASNASSIRRGERWKDYSNPFNGLGAR